MGALWTAGLPLVSLPACASPRPVTFVYPYYQNPEFFARQVAWWSTYPAWLRAQLSAIIVDDGSPTPAVLPEGRPFPMRLFRIDVDVRWNWLAARNIGLHYAPEGWVLLTDMDHVVPASTATALVHGAHDPGVIYGLSRIASTGEPLPAHPNSWFLTRAMFWRVGGYDERLSGYYGTDGPWRKRLAATAPIHILTDRLIRHEYDGDSSTLAYKRKQPEDAAVRRILGGLPRDAAPLTLSFPYHEVVAVEVS